jgi:hypothetical protein
MATDTQVDFGFNAGDRFGAPPLFKLLRFGPSLEETFS